MKQPRGSSRQAIFWIQVVYVLLLGIFVLFYRLEIFFKPRKDFLGPIPFLVPWFGALGAALLSLKGVFDHRGRDWNPEYCYWHWSRPLVGATVGTLGVLIFQSGILAVGGETPNQADSTTTPKNLLFYLVAFVVGYREDVFRELIKRLADVVLTPSPEARAAPLIESVEPPEAVFGQETNVTLVGSGFARATSVKLGEKDIDFVGGSDTRMTLTVPDDAPKGLMDLVVSTKDGTITTPFKIREP